MPTPDGWFLDRDELAASFLDRRTGAIHEDDGWLLGNDGLTPALLDPGTYAIHVAKYGRGGDDIVLAPGDVRGTRFVHELVIGPCPCCYSGSSPCLACGECGASVACRVDDDRRPQSTRFLTDMVVWEHCGEEPALVSDPFARGAAWDRRASRRELVATHWRTRGLKSEVYRDDPPA